ncbi:MAG: hypothetical protein D6754_13545 [Alphaproteobacteria bacterium]|nr:MAG: hypothetical protein D6754_13545 [Alphaproteobacteria bacterium]
MWGHRAWGHRAWGHRAWDQRARGTRNAWAPHRAAGNRPVHDTPRNASHPSAPFPAAGRERGTSAEQTHIDTAKHSGFRDLRQADRQRRVVTAACAGPV